MLKNKVFKGFSLALSAAMTMMLLAMPCAAAERDLPIYCVGRDDNCISISFDAAWGNEDTQTLIDILAKYNIRATFFVVGDWVDKYPESVKALHDAGHEIMNHSNTHAHYPQLSRTQMIADVSACADKIEAVTGVRPTLFRPPYGDYNDTVVGAMREAGFYTIQWDVDSLDWKNPGSDAIRQRVLDKVKSGSIVLFHNAAVQTPAALPGIIEGLLAKGYTFLPISELIYKENYHMEHDGTQRADG
jgi:polysaccharide deacetylase family sporulation protein PdaB